MNVLQCDYLDLKGIFHHMLTFASTWASKVKKFWPWHFFVAQQGAEWDLFLRCLFESEVENKCIMKKQFFIDSYKEINPEWNMLL